MATKIKYSEFSSGMLDDITTGNGLIIIGMPNDVYHALPGISKSGLDLIARSPAHYAFREYREPTRAMQLGSATHAAILEPELFAKQYMLLTDVSDRRGSEYKQAVKEYGADNVLTSAEAQQVRGMVDAVKQNPHAVQRLNEAGEAELSVFARDPETDVLVKCRFDFLSMSGKSLDLKTTQDLRDFARSVANYRYHVQQAFYEDVYFWATGEYLQAFDFLALESSVPHANRIITLDTPSVDYGRKLYREALNAYAECLESDTWPMPSFEPEFITLPSWAADPEQYEGEF